jgi:hypothetical protein
MSVNPADVERPEFRSWRNCETPRSMLVGNADERPVSPPQAA